MRLRCSSYMDLVYACASSPEDFDSSLEWSVVSAASDEDHRTPLGLSMMTMSDKQKKIVLGMFNVWVFDNLVGISKNKPPVTWAKLAPKIKSLLDPAALVGAFMQTSKEGGLAQTSDALIKHRQEIIIAGRERSRQAKRLEMRDEDKLVPDLRVDDKTVEAIRGVLEGALLAEVPGGQRFKTLTGLPEATAYHEVILARLVGSLAKGYQTILKNENLQPGDKPLPVPEAFEKATAEQARTFLEQLQKNPQLVPYLRFARTPASRRDRLTKAALTEHFNFIGDPTGDSEDKAAGKASDDAGRSAVKSDAAAEKTPSTSKNPGGVDMSTTLSMFGSFLSNAQAASAASESATGMRGATKANVLSAAFNSLDKYLEKKGLAPGLFPVLPEGTDFDKMTPQEAVKRYRSVRGEGASSISLGMLSEAVSSLSLSSDRAAQLMLASVQVKKAANVSEDPERKAGLLRVAQGLVDSGNKLLNTPGSDVKRADKELEAVNKMLKQVAAKPAETPAPLKAGVKPSAKPAKAAKKDQNAKNAALAKALREHYGKFTSIDPGSELFKALNMAINEAAPDALEYIAKADIKFASALAKARLAKLAPADAEGVDATVPRAKPARRKPAAAKKPGAKKPAAKAAAKPVGAHGKQAKALVEAAHKHGYTYVGMVEAFAKQMRLRSVPEKLGKAGAVSWLTERLADGKKATALSGEAKKKAPAKAAVKKPADKAKKKPSAKKADKKVAKATKKPAAKKAPAKKPAAKKAAGKAKKKA